MKLFLVGGIVRDRLRGIDGNDWDFTCTLDEQDVEIAALCKRTPYEEMRFRMEAEGFTFFPVPNGPEHFTLRGRAPEGFKFAGADLSKQDVDVVLARKDVTTDGRHAQVELGTLHDDLARRDFTMNAIAQADNGSLIDPFDGRADIQRGIIRCVGIPARRFAEDSLRVLRALRFAAQLDFRIAADLERELWQNAAWWLTVRPVSADRLRVELEKALRANPVLSCRMLLDLGLFDVLAAAGLRLTPTSAK